MLPATGRAEETQEIEARVSARFNPTLRELRVARPATRRLFMKRDQRHGRNGAAILAFLMLFAAGTILSSTVRAQYPNDRSQNQRNMDRYGNYGGSAELRQTALTAGYNDGVKEASQNDRLTNYQTSNAYRRATNGYSARLGDREIYRRYFREAFESGFNGYAQNNRDNGNGNRDGNNKGNQTRHGRNWDGYGKFGGSPELRQTALNAGYNEGIKQGRGDRNRRYRSNYHDQSNYKKATQDYSSKLGDREVYQRYYREAYGNGYEDGVGGN
jgi:hypothetical protein